MQHRGKRELITVLGISHRFVSLREVVGSETEPAMERQPPLDTRASLKVRWRNSLTFAWGGVLLVALGTAIELFPGTGPLPLSGAIMIVPGLLFLGAAVYLGRSVVQDERRLRQAGLPWKVDRSLLGSERRTLDFDVSRERVVTAAVDVLWDPSLGLDQIRPTRSGARALMPGDREGPLGLLLVRYPLTVNLTVHAHGAGSRLRLSITPAMVWTAWLTIQSSTNWVAAGQELADYLAARIGSKLGQPTT